MMYLNMYIKQKHTENPKQMSLSPHPIYSICFLPKIFVHFWQCSQLLCSTASEQAGFSAQNWLSFHAPCSSAGI